MENIALVYTIGLILSIIIFWYIAVFQYKETFINALPGILILTLSWPVVLLVFVVTFFLHEDW